MLNKVAYSIAREDSPLLLPKHLEQEYESSSGVRVILSLGF